MPSQLKDEFDYYVENQDAFVRQFNGKVIVIKEKKLLGVYDSEPEAVFATQKTEPLGTFLVQKVSPGTDAYTQTFHSRVVFAK